MKKIIITPDTLAGYIGGQLESQVSLENSIKILRGEISVIVINQDKKTIVFKLVQCVEVENGVWQKVDKINCEVKVDEYCFSADEYFRVIFFPKFPDGNFIVLFPSSGK